MYPSTNLMYFYTFLFTFPSPFLFFLTYFNSWYFVTFMEITFSHIIYSYKKFFYYVYSCQWFYHHQRAPYSST